MHANVVCLTQLWLGFVLGFAFSQRLRGCAAAQCADTASSKPCGALSLCAHVAGLAFGRVPGLPRAMLTACKLWALAQGAGMLTGGCAMTIKQCTLRVQQEEYG